MAKFTNILLVEDDVSDYSFFVEALQRIAPTFEVTHAKNALECMAILKSAEKPDIVFLDLNMSGLNGRDCLKFIKTNKHLADIPAVVYSVSHYIKDIDSCFKIGAHYYIVKPSNADYLFGMLNQVLKNLDENMERPPKEKFVIGLEKPEQIE